MNVNSEDIRSFYSSYYDSRLDSKSSEYLVLNYQKTSNLLDSLQTEVLPKFKDYKKYLAFEQKLVALKSQYFSALCNRFMGVVFNVARKIKGSSITEHDMFSYGEEILLKCLSKWKPNSKASFISYFTQSVFNMSYTLKHKKHFRDWTKSIVSLDELVDSEDCDFNPTEDDKMSYTKQSISVPDKSLLNDELNKLIFNPEMAHSIRTKLGIKDDLYLHYIILNAKYKSSIINSDEIEKLIYLKGMFGDDGEGEEKEFSSIYTYEYDSYKLKQKQQKLKEELLWQE